MTPTERFWAMVKKGDGCWEWQGAVQPNGYGAFGVTRKDIRAAHRFAWELTYGPIPDRLLVLHSCDNPPCVRPDHLSLGTQADNMAQAKERGRTARGEGHGRRKLNADQVADLRRKRQEGWNLRELADWFSISLAAVSLIARGVHWAEAGGPLAPKDPRWFGKDEGND